MPAIDPHKPLRDDIRLLGELLGDTLRLQDTDLYARVEAVRAMAKEARLKGDQAFGRLTEVLGSMPIDAAIPIARAFSQFLALANVAEQHHRERRRRVHARGEDGASQRGSCGEAFARLIAGGVAPHALASAVGNLHIELVLTAHPTEIVRRTLIQKYNRIAHLLAEHDRPDLTPTERDDTVDALRRVIAEAWQTDEMREHRVRPLDEVRAGLVVFEETLWDAAPAFLRALDRALQTTIGTALPLGAAPITFGSWMGGDRDGNPNVTPEVTRRATELARWQAADLYLREVNLLRDELSLASASPELTERVNGAHEPYRELLRDVRDRLIATRDEVDSHDVRRDDAPAPVALPLRAAEDLAEPLRLCYRSLIATGNVVIARGRLTDLLRRVAMFGLVLARLDIRQDSARHAEAVDWVFAQRGVGLAGLDERERLRLHVEALETGIDTSALPIDAAPASVRDVIETCRVAASLHPESLGAYVITMTRRASDILAVELLQRLVGNQHPQRVVPLFETADDLSAAGDILRTLFALPWYRERIGGRQEVMVGYSDSAKDAGRLSAAWALYRAQETIVSAARDAGVALTLFHGRGGTIGRGGGPTSLAIRSQPPGSIDGTLRVTEQGEMIQAKFGLLDIAERTLEVYTTSVLEAMLRPPEAARPAWRSCMDRLFADSRDAYRAVVRGRPEFVEYFRAATPEPELRTINVGSRPARRQSSQDVGIESLRAIPWQFAWTQTRLLLATWLGVETALDRASARGDEALVAQMYEQWPFFQSTIDLIEMALAKSDARIAALYDRELVPPALQPLGHELRSRLRRAVDAILHVTRHAVLVESNAVLRRSIDVRNPYVDPINLVQVEVLRRLRAAGGGDERLHHAFVVTVNGIAAGLRNTG